MRLQFSAMTQRVHMARWIDQISDTGWAIVFFDFSESGIIEEFRSVTTYLVRPPLRFSERHGTSNSTYPFRSGSAFLKQHFPNLPYPFFTRRHTQMFRGIIKRFDSGIIHSMALQHESYPLLVHIPARQSKCYDPYSCNKIVKIKNGLCADLPDQPGKSQNGLRKFRFDQSLVLACWSSN